MNSDTKRSEIDVYDGLHRDRPEYGSLWESEHHRRLLEYGPEGAFDRLLEEHARGDVLVLGCGKGERTRQIAALEGTETVCGIELSAKRLAAARERAERASFFRADAEELPFGDGVFDTVVAHSVLHHLPNWSSEGLDEIVRVLGPEGRMLFYEPGKYNPPAAFRRAFLPSRIHTPDEHPFDPTVLVGVLRARFSHVETTGHCLFSNVLRFVDRLLPLPVPFGVTRQLYDLEQRLFGLLGTRGAWILTGCARL